MKTLPTGDTVYGQALIHDIIMGTLTCSQTGAFHKCPMRGFPQQLTEKDAENDSEIWDGPWRLLMQIWGSIEGPQDGRNSTGSLTETMNV